MLRERVGVVGAELRLPQRQRLLAAAAGPGRACRRPVGRGEVAHARERVGVVGAEPGGEGGAGLGEQDDRLLGVAQAELRCAQGHLHPGHGQRVADRLPLDLRPSPGRAARPGGRSGWPSFVAVRRVQVLEDRAAGSRWPSSLLAPAASRPRCRLVDRRSPAAAGPRSAPASSRRCPPTSASSTSAAATTWPRFRRTNFRSRYAAVGGPARDRLVVEEPLDVVGQADRRLVPPLPLLGQRLHHDPVEVAPHEPAQPRRLDLAVGGEARQRLGRADPAAAASAARPRGSPAASRPAPPA